MDGTSLIWGLAAIAAGIFVCAYGSALFRFVLAVIGFMVGFSLVMALAASASPALQWILALVAGGIGALLLYRLFNLSLYIAGGILGAAIVIAVLGLFGLTGGGLGIIGWILVLVGAGVVGFFGKRIGDLVIVFATALAGATLVVYGLARVFAANIGNGSADPTKVLSGAFALLVWATIALISGLAQYQVQSMRRRFMR
jgi:hypothetical protein